MHTTGDQYLVKKINKSIVLELIRHHSPLSRAKVSEISGLNKGTVSSLVGELIESELVHEIGPGESSGGRRPLMLLFNNVAGYAIGIDLRVQELLGVLTDLQGMIIEEVQLPLLDPTYSSVLAQIESLIHTLISSAPDSPHGIVGIGIGVPGTVDGEGTVLFAPNLKWKETKLQQDLMTLFDIPITIDNEANAGAQGELRFGAGIGFSNMIFVSVGIGIGTGVVLNKELFKGTSGFSGEVGHTTIEVQGKSCSCGNHGCWELYASEQALFEYAGIRDFEHILRLAEQGDTKILQAFEQLGRYLGIGIANLVNILNPELMIIGNEMSRAEPYLAESIRKTVAERSLPYHHQGLQIQFARLGNHSTVLGAAYYAISQFFDKDKVSI